MSDMRKYLAKLDDLEMEIEAGSHMQARQAIAKKYREEKKVDYPMAYLIACASSELIEKKDRKVYTLGNST